MQALHARRLDDPRSGCRWVHAAAIRHELRAGRLRLPQHVGDDGNGVGHVAGVRVAGLLTLEDRHRQLGKKIEAKIIELALFKDLHRGIRGIAPKTGSCSRAYRFSSHQSLRVWILAEPARSGTSKTPLLSHWPPSTVSTSPVM